MGSWTCHCPCDPWSRRFIFLNLSVRTPALPPAECVPSICREECDASWREPWSQRGLLRPALSFPQTSSQAQEMETVSVSGAWKGRVVLSEHSELKGFAILFPPDVVCSC